MVSDPEAAGTATRFRFAVDRLTQDGQWQEVSGKALVTVRESTELVRLRDQPYFRYGDRLLLQGTLEAPRVLEDFDYPAYLARQGIGSVMPFPEATLLEAAQGVPFYRWLYSVRQRIADSLARVVSEPQAAVGQALLLGLQDSLPEDLVDDFRVSGASHLLAISGLHVGILLGAGLVVSPWLLGRRRHLYLIPPLVLIWLYALISGMSPSVTRAAIMGSVYLAALFVGRPRSVLPALGLAAAVMVANSPGVLWSISFQLSFAAMAGIAFVAEPLGRWLQGLFGEHPQTDRTLASVLAPAATIVAMTIAATFATLPIVAFYFQQVSLVGLPATLLVLPALPFILLTQAVAGLVGLLSTGVAQPLGWLAWVTTAYLTGVVGLLARVPGAAVETGRVAPVLAWAYYGAVVLVYMRVFQSDMLSRRFSWLITLGRSSPFGSWEVRWWLWGPAVSLAALLWIAVLASPDGKLRVAFIDVGQGDAAFITTPGGQQVLVDGGPDPVKAVQFLGSAMPFRDRTVELVVLTHPHSDHVNGLIEVLRRYDVRHILEREIGYDSPPYQAWRRAVADEGAQVIEARAGLSIVLDDSVSIEVLSPPDTLLKGTESDVDNASVVIRIVFGDRRFLLTGDMFAEGETLLVRRGAAMDSDVLKVGHHGSRSSSSEEFLDRVGPTAAVVSAGEGNRFGHPHPDVMEGLRKRVQEELLFLISESGTVEFVTDGRRLEVTTER